ncbi:MAG TPA: DUF5305 family protein [Dehalococcoidia bacterium]|nr:DUF5305 family protein [Dehalococcoidia bacterium]
MKPGLSFLDRDEYLLAALGILGGVATALTVLAVYAFVLPAVETKTETIASYQHTGAYTYAASSEPSAINPSGSVRSQSKSPGGDSAGRQPAIFTRLARTFDFAYIYQIEGVSNVEGLLSADLEIRGDSWSDTSLLSPETSFKGASGLIEGTIYFSDISALLDQVEEQTGVSSGTVELIITPNVEVHGEANGQQINESYSSPFKLTYSSSLITPEETLTFSEPKTITSTESLDKWVGLLGSRILVRDMRLVATPLAVIALIGTAFFAAVYFLGAWRPEAQMIRARYSSILVPISDVESAVSHRIRVAYINDLAQLAKREGRSLFMREFENGSLAYLVHDGMVVYHYTIGDVPQDWIKSPAQASADPSAEPQRPAPVSASELSSEIPEWLAASSTGQRGNGDSTDSLLVNGEGEPRPIANVDPPVSDESQSDPVPDASEEPWPDFVAAGPEDDIPAGSGGWLSRHRSVAQPDSGAGADDLQGEATDESNPASFEDGLDYKGAEQDTDRVASEITPISESSFDPAADRVGAESEEPMAAASHVEQPNGDDGLHHRALGGAAVGRGMAPIAVRQWLRKRSGGPLADPKLSDESLERPVGGGAPDAKPSEHHQEDKSGHESHEGAVDFHSPAESVESDRTPDAELSGQDTSHYEKGAEFESELYTDTSNDQMEEPLDEGKQITGLGALDLESEDSAQISQHGESQASSLTGSDIIDEATGVEASARASEGIPAEVPWRGRRRSSTTPLQAKLTNQARRWLRDFLEYPPDERRNDE